MNARTDAAAPASLLQQAQEVLSALDSEAREAWQRLRALETHEQRVRLELSAVITRDPGTSRGTPGALRKSLDELMRERNEILREKARQWDAVRDVRERLRTARTAHEELVRRGGELQTAIRREERAIAHWEQQIKETQQQLARWEQLLAEAQARLEQAQREYAELAGHHLEA